YTHRVAISNRRLIACDEKGVTFKWKDYRLEGRERYSDALKAGNNTAHPPQTPEHRCPRCGGPMMIIERFERGATPHYRPSPPTPVISIDTSCPWPSDPTPQCRGLCLPPD